MTDPRMTPTNDAPVKVEPAAELAEMLQVGTETGAFDHTPEEIGLHVMENAQAILNALASAPAIDESRAVALVRRIASREPWQSHYGRTWEDEAADIVAGLAASAPAGDGVEERARLAIAPVIHWYQSDEHPDRPLDEILADIVADLQEDRAAALARPRAAVDANGWCSKCGCGNDRSGYAHLAACPTNGDDETCTGCYGSGFDPVREAVCHCQPEQARAAVGERDVDLAEAARDLLDAQKRLGPAVAFRLDLWACLEANLEDRS